MVISWVVGACALNAAGFALISHGLSVWAIFSDWHTILLSVFAVIPTSLLGFFLGVFTCWPWIRAICSRYNGSPLRVGDHVLILSGPQKGDFALVYEITVGQGGWNVARLDLGEEREKKFKDIFEEYSLLKIEIEPDHRYQTFRHFGRPAKSGLDASKESRKIAIE
jgi:hypothetical protein